MESFSANKGLARVILASIFKLYGLTGLPITGTFHLDSRLSLIPQFVLWTPLKPQPIDIEHTLWGEHTHLCAAPRGDVFTFTKLVIIVHTRAYLYVFWGTFFLFLPEITLIKLYFHT